MDEQVVASPQAESFGARCRRSAADRRCLRRPSGGVAIRPPRERPSRPYRRFYSVSALGSAAGISDPERRSFLLGLFTVSLFPALTRRRALIGRGPPLALCWGLLILTWNWAAARSGVSGGCGGGWGGGGGVCRRGRCPGSSWQWRSANPWWRG